MQAKTLFHKLDPDTSRQAAEKMVESGKLNEQENWIYSAIERYCNFLNHEDFTPKDITGVFVIPYHTIQRRLSGLHRKGKIERTGEKRDGCCVWRLT